MNTKILTTTLFLVTALASAAPAQSGTIDQVSAYGSVGFSGHPAHVWQNTVQAGVDGQLMGVDVGMYGFTGTSGFVRIRIGGGGWNTNAHVVETMTTNLSAGGGWVHVDASAANIQLNAGDQFVIELAGFANASGNPTGWSGTNAAPQYPGLLYLNGALFSQPTYRMSFRTYMEPSWSEHCFGTGCPCGNDDANAGCSNSTGLGSHLTVTAGTTSVAADDLELTASGLPSSVNGIFFMGDATISQPFGSGLRCAGGVVKRFPVSSSTAGGTMTLNGPAGLKPTQILAGTTWNFQVWYRDASGPCTATTNLSSAVEIPFQP